jgi:hypothetical protein
MSGAGASGWVAVRAAGAPALATTGPEARPGNDTVGDQPAVRKIVRGVQISLRTISGALHLRYSICITDLIERMSTSLYQPQCLLCHTLYRPLSAASAAGGGADRPGIRSHLGVVNSAGYVSSGQVRR